MTAIEARVELSAPNSQGLGHDSHTLHGDTSLDQSSSVPLDVLVNAPIEVFSHDKYELVSASASALETTLRAGGMDTKDAHDRVSALVKLGSGDANERESFANELNELTKRAQTNSLTPEETDWLVVIREVMNDPGVKKAFSQSAGVFSGGLGSELGLLVLDRKYLKISALMQTPTLKEKQSVKKLYGSRSVALTRLTLGLTAAGSVLAACGGIAPAVDLGVQPSEPQVLEAHVGPFNQVVIKDISVLNKLPTLSDSERELVKLSANAMVQHRENLQKSAADPKLASDYANLDLVDPKSGPGVTFVHYWAQDQRQGIKVDAAMAIYETSTNRITGEKNYDVMIRNPLTGKIETRSAVYQPEYLDNELGLVQQFVIRDVSKENQGNIFMRSYLAKDSLGKTYQVMQIIDPWGQKGESVFLITPVNDKSTKFKDFSAMSASILQAGWQTWDQLSSLFPTPVAKGSTPTPQATESKPTTAPATAAATATEKPTATPESTNPLDPRFSESSLEEYLASNKLTRAEYAKQLKDKVGIVKYGNYNVNGEYRTLFVDNAVIIDRKVINNGGEERGYLVFAYVKEVNGSLEVVTHAALNDVTKDGIWSGVLAYDKKDNFYTGDNLDSKNGFLTVLKRLIQQKERMRISIVGSMSEERSQTNFYSKRKGTGYDRSVMDFSWGTSNTYPQMLNDRKLPTLAKISNLDEFYSEFASLLKNNNVGVIVANFSFLDR